MNSNTSTLTKKAGYALSWLSSMAVIATATVYAYPAVFADAAGNGEKVITGVLSVIYIIANAVGIIFVALGLLKLAIAHAQEDGPAQQKAALMTATGLLLILLRLILAKIDFEKWIDTTTRGGGN